MRRHLPFVMLLYLFRESRLPVSADRRRDSFLHTCITRSFPHGKSALILVCAWLRCVAETQWGTKKYLNTKRLKNAVKEAVIAG